MAPKSRYLSTFGQAQCLRLPPATEAAWDWQLQGSCRGQAPELFFPDEHITSNRRRQESIAKQICRDCPVLQQCRDHALRTPEPHGIWGGMTARERARVLSRPSQTPAPTPTPAAKGRPAVSATVRAVSSEMTAAAMR
jgi:WhiB family transcriptional regulator, redox-sensing transcriptional regulator